MVPWLVLAEYHDEAVPIMRIGMRMYMTKTMITEEMFLVMNLLTMRKQKRTMKVMERKMAP